MEDLEMVCLNIISNAGEARSQCMSALAAARIGEFDTADACLKEAGQQMKEAHQVHSKLITMDANEELGEIRLILVHSEDIMMGSEITLSLASEIVEIYKR